jgi:hypothetical protein
VKVRRDGLTVTVADTPPALAVALRVCHEDRELQNHVHKFTYVNGSPWNVFDASGERLPDGRGSSTLRSACKATARGSTRVGAVSNQISVAPVLRGGHTVQS